MPICNKIKHFKYKSSFNFLHIKALLFLNFFKLEAILFQYPLNIIHFNGLK